MSLQDASFVVVDTETTGGRASGDRLIEIAAVRVKDGKIIDQYQQLINPECTIPGRITWLTGINTTMVLDQPCAVEALPEFLSFLDDGVFVAHNLAFDLRFVNEEQARAGLPALNNHTLCTLRLARRLLPGLRSKGLASLVDFYGIRMKRRHRALDDAQATAEVLLRFLDQLDLEYGVETLEDVLTFQHRRYADLQQVSRHITHVRENVLNRLPQKPGVYFMKDGKRKTIYIGKAQNLSNRVRSYFTSIEGHPPRIRKMVKSVRDIEWQVTESELDALLLESKLIKENQPTYNRAQRQYVNRPFIRIDTTHSFPHASFSAFLHNDGSEYYGPLASRYEAAFVVDVIDRFFRLRKCDDDTFAKGKRCMYASMGQCTAPCESRNREEYDVEVRRVRSFLSGEDDSVTERIEVAMRAASAELDFEQAGQLRDWMQMLHRMLGKRRAVAGRVLDHNVVILQRTSSGTPVRLLIVRRGMHAETITMSIPPEPEDTAALRNALNTYFVEFADEPDSYREKEIDEIYLLSHWLHVHKNELRHIRWEPTMTVDDVLSRVKSELTVWSGDPSPS